MNPIQTVLDKLIEEGEGNGASVQLFIDGAGHMAGQIRKSPADGIYVLRSILESRVDKKQAPADVYIPATKIVFVTAMVDQVIEQPHSKIHIPGR